MSGLRASVDRRIRVLIVRRRLEHAATMVERASGERPRRQRLVVHRLMLLTAEVPTERWVAAYGLARRAGTVYGETSTVLHSNRAFGDVPEQLVKEWEHVVADVENAVEEPFGDQRS